MPLGAPDLKGYTMQTATPPAFVPEYLKRATGSRLREYFVAPVTHHRDSDLLTESNWSAQWETLSPLHAEVPGDPDDEGSPCIVRDGNPLVGWAEWVAIHQDNLPALKAADEIAGRLESYPVLDEDDVSRREWEDYAEGWRQYGQSDFFALVAAKFLLCSAAKDWLRDECPEDIAREFFETCVPSGEFYTPEGSGVSIRGDSAVRHLVNVDNCRDTLAQFIQRARKAAREVAA